MVVVGVHGGGGWMLVGGRMSMGACECGACECAVHDFSYHLAPFLTLRPELINDATEILLASLPPPPPPPPSLPLAWAGAE
jgi:hypothetical protein